MSTVIHEITTQDKLRLAANKKYDKFNSESITMLSTTPKNVQYTTAKISLNGSSSIEFNTTIGAKTFMDRGLVLEMNIPLTITRAANAVGVTNANYIETFFNSFADLAFRQYPFIQCLSNVEVSLNDTPISMISDMADCFEAVSNIMMKMKLMSSFKLRSLIDFILILITLINLNLF
jgi:hypothetical protein